MIKVNASCILSDLRREALEARIAYRSANFLLGGASQTVVLSNYAVSKTTKSVICVAITAALASLGRLLPLNGVDPGRFELSDICEVAFGKAHTLALDSQACISQKHDAIFLGDSGQLGLGATHRVKRALYDWVPVNSLQGRKVVSLGCGSRHSAVVTAVGDVYTWGRGFEGQTGHAPLNNDTSTVDDLETQGLGIHLLPKLVVSLASQLSTRDPAMLVACGQNFTIVVTAAGVPWAWGEGRCGELGIGKCTASQRTPTRVCWPNDASSCCNISCGWAHVLATDTAGALWGFNRFGQLGLGLKCSVQNFDFQDKRGSNKCNSDMLLKPVPVSLFPGRVKLIETAANSSAALRDEDGMLFCWGSGESARLGHGPVQAEENESMEIAPVEYPRAVQGMRGRVISSIALTEDGGFAFVPSSVSLVEPPLLPISGGAKLILRGGGFWDSSDCVVKFIPVRNDGCFGADMHSNLPRSSVGKYIPPGAEFASSDDKPGVLCKLPRFSVPCDAFVEVAMNGKDFTRNRVRVTLYQEPVLDTIEPVCCNCVSTTNLAVSGTHLFESGLIKVRFKERGNSGREWMAPASFSPHASLSVHHIDIEPQPRMNGDGTITCMSPRVDAGEFPVETRVSVALNGHDFINLHKVVFVIHDAALSGLVPDCRQSVVSPEDSAQNLPSRVVKIQGQSFFDSSKMLVRLRVELDREEIICRCDANYLSRDAITFIPPSLMELVAIKNGPKLSSESDGDVTDEDVNPGPNLLEKKAWFCKVQLSLNGTDFLDCTLPFLLYGSLHPEETQTIGPTSGPSAGGSRLLFRLPSWFAPNELSAWPNYESAIVKLEPKGNFAHLGPVITHINRELLSNDEGDKYELGVTFLTPGFDLESNSISQHSCMNSIVLDTTTENSNMAIESDRQELDANVPHSSLVQDAPAIRHAEMGLYLALDGENFSPMCKTNFTYYATPRVHYLNVSGDTGEDAPVVKPGMEVSVYGAHFFNSDSLKVQLAYTGVESGETEYTHVDAVCSSGVVKFTTPKLSTEAGEHHEHHASPQGQRGNELDGGVDDTVQDQLRVVVEVTFNGVDFSLDGCSFAYQHD